MPECIFVMFHPGACLKNAFENLDGDIIFCLFDLISGLKAYSFDLLYSLMELNFVVIFETIFFSNCITLSMFVYV